MAQKRKPSKPSPKPAVKRKAGRPEGTGYHPTQEQRDLVKAMAGYKIAEDEICLLVINPKSKRPISPMTLRKHFRDELDTGFISGKMRVMAATFRNAIGDKEHPGNVTAQIWLGKTMYGMREKVDIDIPPPAPTDSGETTLLDAARRVAFTLAMGADLASKAAQPKKKAKETA